MSKFELGMVVATPGAIAASNDLHIHACLVKHHSGDWGLVPEEDALLNEEALKLGNRIMSVYPVTPGVEGGRNLWIITEADRSSTTVLLPDEY